MTMQLERNLASLAEGLPHVPYSLDPQSTEEFHDIDNGYDSIGVASRGFVIPQDMVGMQLLAGSVSFQVGGDRETGAVAEYTGYADPVVAALHALPYHARLGIFEHAIVRTAYERLIDDTMERGVESRMSDAEKAAAFSALMPMLTETGLVRHRDDN